MAAYFLELWVLAKHAAETQFGTVKQMESPLETFPKQAAVVDLFFRRQGKQRERATCADIHYHALCELVKIQ